MKILGIDFGLKKIGLALTEGYLVEPLDVLGVKGKIEKTIQKINFICEKEKVERVVIGLPESGLVERIKNFGEKIHQATDLPVFYQAETLTTKDALDKMKEAGIRGKARRKKEDAFAAALILQNWLDKTNV